VVIRPATRHDVAAIRAVALATWPVAYAEILGKEQLAYMLDLMYSEASLLEQMEAKGHQFLVALEEGLIPGFASYELRHQGSLVTKLHKLYVRPQAQGTGWGARLLRAVEQRAKHEGQAVLELNVNRHNRALDFYLDHGFQKLRSEVIDIGKGYVMDDHVMVKDMGV
jgi:diamine N-acetyltransferase